MLALCLTVWNRPDCLRGLLRSLRRVRGLQDWQLFVQLEPSERQEELISSLQAAHLPCRVELVCNAVRQGVRANPLQCLERAWKTGAKAFLLLEDDLELSADALEFVLNSLQLTDWDIRYACGNLHFSTCFNHAHLQGWNRADAQSALVAMETYFLSSLGLFLVVINTSVGFAFTGGIGVLGCGVFMEIAFPAGTAHSTRRCCLVHVRACRACFRASAIAALRVFTLMPLTKKVGVLFRPSRSASRFDFATLVLASVPARQLEKRSASSPILVARSCGELADRDVCNSKALLW